METNKRVLVIDDDPMIRSLVQSILESEGYKVSTAEDGLQGVELLDAEPRPIDLNLIILDVIMPGMNT